MTAEALTRPVCRATIRDDDTVSVTIDAVERTFASMPEAIGYLASTAGDLGRPVKVAALDPSSTTQPETHLIVSEDGSVDADSSVPAKKRPPRRITPAPGQSAPSSSSVTPATGEDADAVSRAPIEALPIFDTAATIEPAQHEPADAPDKAGRPVPVTGTVPKSSPEPRVTPEAGLQGTASTAIQVEPGDARIQLRPEVRAEKAAAPARVGWRGWLNATFKANLTASPAEQASRERRARIQRPLETHCTMAVVQLKGGATKTTVAYHLAATYGRIRGGNILAGEFNENQGTLGERALSGAHDRSTLDLIRNLDTVTRRTSDLVRYIRPQGDDRIHVLASPPEGADRRRVDGTSVKAAHDVLLSLYNLILLDTGNSAQASTWQAAVDVADSLVFVAQNKADDFKLLEATIEGVKAQGHAGKFARSILVITNTAQPNAERLAQLQEYGTSIGLAAVIVVPFDRSLQEGQDFDYEALNPATRQAYEEATAALTDQL
ncbi:MinD-like ATPase involved in chromosome partitioning or flagellar assembly [Arthrobacter sp. CAN_A6]|uniref:MinD/ParA family ATP-binding protein n=1 Tax=Arthrobacter sp. CAN_A6 TaxID=2787721 RepID=UPI0018CB77C8